MTDEDCVKKPPLGLIPRFIWDEKRMSQIEEAIIRYVLNDEKVPAEWIEELSYLYKKRKPENP